MTAHTKVSFIKSALRGIGYTLLLVDIWSAVGVLLVSELIGILEECVI